MSFSIGSVGHALAVAAHDVKVGAVAFGNFFKAHQQEIKTDLQITAGVLSVIPGLGPTAQVIERAGEASLGLIAGAIDTVEADIAATPGDTVAITVHVAKDLFADFKQLIPALKGQMPTATATIKS